jgi:uncharacterized protein
MCSQSQVQGFTPPMSKVTFEIPAQNMDRAKTFYQDIFGWRIDPLPALDYLLVNVDGRPIDPKAV